MSIRTYLHIFMSILSMNHLLFFQKGVFRFCDDHKACVWIAGAIYAELLFCFLVIIKYEY